MTRASMQYIPLSSAYLCQDCSCVGNCAEQCPACASTVLMTLAGVLDREDRVRQQPALAYSRTLAACGFPLIPGIFRTEPIGHGI